MDNSLSLQVFQNNKFGKLHYIVKEGEPWFLAKDVANALGYNQSSDMVRLLDERDISKIEPSMLMPIANVSPHDPSALYADGSIHKKTSKPLTLINESGLYNAIFNSRKLEAREFKYWVTSEVLPSIRRTGSYSIENDTDDLLIALKKSAQNANHILKVYSEQLAIRKEQEQLKLEQQSQKQELNNLKETIEFQTKGDQYYTISGYARKLKIKLARNTKIMYGKLAKKLSLKLGYDTGFISHPEYNKVNTYHQDILELVFEDDKQDEFDF